MSLVYAALALGERYSTEDEGDMEDEGYMEPKADPSALPSG